MHLLEARKKSRHILIGRCRVHLHDILPYVSCSVHQGSCSAQWKVVLSLVHAQLCWPSLSGLLDCSWCPCTETTTSSERKRKDIALEITGTTSMTSIYRNLLYNNWWSLESDSLQTISDLRVSFAFYSTDPSQGFLHQCLFRIYFRTVNNLKRNSEKLYNTITPNKNSNKYNNKDKSWK